MSLVDADWIAWFPKPLLLTAIKGLHKIGYVHREMKLDNAAIGRIKEEEQLVYLLDFGMAHRFLTKGHHHKERSKVAFQWTLQYAPHPRTWNGHTERQFQNCRGKGSSREVEVPETVRNEAFENLLEGCPKEFASPQTHRWTSILRRARLHTDHLHFAQSSHLIRHQRTPIRLGDPAGGIALSTWCSAYKNQDINELILRYLQTLNTIFKKSLKILPGVVVVVSKRPYSIR
ncbi:hypothetical protein GPALN_003250 [Globodera pallida]|nr:hypothetical protein GPALN_003250 [Globodera pallida]